MKTTSLCLRLLFNISHQASSAKFWRTDFFWIISHFLCYLLIRWRELIGPNTEINSNWCCERRSSRIILASVQLMQMIPPWKWTHKPYSSQRRWPQGPQQPALYYSQLWPAGWTFQSTGGSQRSDTLDAPWGRADGREDVLSRSAESKTAGVSWLKSAGLNPPQMKVKQTLTEKMKLSRCWKMWETRKLTDCQVWRWTCCLASRCWRTLAPLPPPSLTYRFQGLYCLLPRTRRRGEDRCEDDKSRAHPHIVIIDSPLYASWKWGDVPESTNLSLSLSLFFVGQVLNCTDSASCVCTWVQSLSKCLWLRPYPWCSQNSPDFLSAWWVSEWVDSKWFTFEWIAPLRFAA